MTGVASHPTAIRETCGSRQQPGWLQLPCAPVPNHTSSYAITCRHGLVSPAQIVVSSFTCASAYLFLPSPFFCDRLCIVIASPRLLAWSHIYLISFALAFKAAYYYCDSTVGIPITLPQRVTLSPGYSRCHAPDICLL